MYAADPSMVAFASKRVAMKMATGGKVPVRPPPPPRGARQRGAQMFRVANLKHTPAWLTVGLGRVFRPCAKQMPLVPW